MDRKFLFGQKYFYDGTYKIRLDGIGYEVVHPVARLGLLATEVGHTSVATLCFSMMMVVSGIRGHVVAILVSGLVCFAHGHAELTPMMMVRQRISRQHHHADCQQ